MATDSPIMGVPVCAPFDPAAWLCHFESIGGAYALTDGGLHLWTLRGDHPLATTVTARVLISRLNAHQRAAIEIHLGAQVGKSPVSPSSNGQSVASLDNAGNAGDHSRSDAMNMMSRITSQDTSSNARAFQVGSYTDENGNRSDRSGPDLTKAEPIEGVIKRLEPLRGDYGYWFYQACRDSGIDVSITRDAAGEDHLMLGCACDVQEEMRRARLDMLCAQVRRGEHRRRLIIEFVKTLGHLVEGDHDNG